MSKASHKTPKRPRSQRLVIVLFSLMCTALCVGLCLWIFNDDFRLSSLQSKGKKYAPQPERYQLLKDDLEIRKQRLQKRFKSAKNQPERDAIITESQDLLSAVLPEMMRCWLGTPWDYHGTSQQPGEGKIACGYFVSTIMRDAGFKLPRIKLSQQASQTILSAFVPRSEMDIRSGMAYTEYCEMLLNREPGIYIVGLDKHVGFIVRSDDSFRFIHSSGSAPWCVVDEAPSDASALEKSNYRVIGNLSDQKSTIIKWLSDEPVYSAH